MNLKLDVFPHIFPQPFFERVKTMAEQNPSLAGQIKRWLHIPVLWDLEARLRMMDRFKGYKQILTLSLPAIEFLAPRDKSPELAMLANDGMAEIVAKHPDYFPAFVASLPMNNIPEALRETDRAIEKLGAKGIQIFTNVNGRPLDDPEFYPIFERMVNKHDLPIWVHPVRTAKFADYVGESKSKYEIYCLFDPEGGPLFIRETIRTIDSLKLKDDDRRKLYFGNAIRMLRLELPGAPERQKAKSRAKPRRKAKKGK